MMTLNILIVFLPLIATMGSLWIQTSCMDSLPKHAISEKRHHFRWGTVLLAMTVIYTAMAAYLAIDMIQTQHPPMIHVTLKISE